MTSLLAVAHGTADPSGLAEIRRLIIRVQSRRPDVPVRLAWLERAEPSLEDMLAELTGPVVVVPLLLCTGYHVKVDIQRAVAGRPRTLVAEQLGPDDRITRAVLQRLAAGGVPGPQVVLFGAGSSDPDAHEQLVEVGVRLQQLLRAGDERTRVFTRTLIDEEWEVGLPVEASVANYLLAPGHFNDRLQQRARSLDSGVVADPIGAHPAVAEVVWDRFDEAVALAGFDVG